MTKEQQDLEDTTSPVGIRPSFYVRFRLLRSDGSTSDELEVQLDVYGMVKRLMMIRFMEQKGDRVFMTTCCYVSTFE